MITITGKVIGNQLQGEQAGVFYNSLWIAISTIEMEGKLYSISWKEGYPVLEVSYPLDYVDGTGYFSSQEEGNIVELKLFPGYLSKNVVRAGKRLILSLAYEEEEIEEAANLSTLPRGGERVSLSSLIPSLLGLEERVDYIQPLEQRVAV